MEAIEGTQVYIQVVGTSHSQMPHSLPTPLRRGDAATCSCVWDVADVTDVTYACLTQPERVAICRFAALVSRRERPGFLGVALHTATEADGRECGSGRWDDVRHRCSNNQYISVFRGERSFEVSGVGV